MTSPGPTESPRLTEWRHGWKVVAAAAVGVAIGGLPPHFIGVMIPHLEVAYGWSRGEVALGVTLISGIALFGKLLVGLLVDRLGVRGIALCGTILFGAAFSLLGMAGPILWTWYFFCILLGLVATCVSPVVWTAGVVQWFCLQRGLALALSLSGGALMIAVTPLIVVWLVSVVGPRILFPVIGITGALLMFATTAYGFHDRKRAKPSVPTSNATGEQQNNTSGHTLAMAFVDRRLWQLMLAIMLVSSAVGTFLVHFQPMLIDAGFSPVIAASVGLYVGGSMMVGRIFIGSLFDYFDPRLVTALAFILPFAATLLLLSLSHNYALAVAAGIVVGLCVGAEIDVVAYLTSRYFGLRSYGLLFAVLMGSYGISFGIGTAIAGFWFDQFGSYNGWLQILGAGSIMATFLVLALGLPLNEISESVQPATDQ